MPVLPRDGLARDENRPALIAAGLLAAGGLAGAGWAGSGARGEQIYNFEIQILLLSRSKRKILKNCSCVTVLLKKRIK